MGGAHLDFKRRLSPLNSHIVAAQQTATSLGGGTPEAICAAQDVQRVAFMCMHMCMHMCMCMHMFMCSMCCYLPSTYVHLHMHMLISCA